MNLVRHVQEHVTRSLFWTSRGPFALPEPTAQPRVVHRWRVLWVTGAHRAAPSHKPVRPSTTAARLNDTNLKRKKQIDLDKLKVPQVDWFLMKPKKF